MVLALHMHYPVLSCSCYLNALSTCVFGVVDLALQRSIAFMFMLCITSLAVICTSVLAHTPCRCHDAVLNAFLWRATSGCRRRSAVRFF